MSALCDRSFNGGGGQPELSELMVGINVNDQEALILGERNRNRWINWFESGSRAARKADTQDKDGQMKATTNCRMLDGIDHTATLQLGRC
jgi:hypothetical protein